MQLVFEVLLLFLHCLWSLRWFVHFLFNRLTESWGHKAADVTTTVEPTVEINFSVTKQRNATVWDACLVTMLLKYKFAFVPNLCVLMIDSCSNVHIKGRKDKWCRINVQYNHCGGETQYCTIMINSAWGGTGDSLAELLSLAKWNGTGNMNLISSLAAGNLAPLSQTYNICS